MKDNMIGKICLVTGGTNGIGRATAHALAQMGATVVIVGRDAQKAAQVSKEIQTASGNQNVDWLLADLSSQQDIRRLAAEFKRKYSQLHVLINNAGGTFMTRQLSVGGIEVTFALNHLAYFLLTNLLLDMIKASAPARVINVSSDAHSGGKIEFDNLQGERPYSGIGPYGNSKLANILFTTELARRLEGSGITANVLHPGTAWTAMTKSSEPRSFPAGMRPLWPILRLIQRMGSPEKVAHTSIYLASAPEVMDITGQYFESSTHPKDLRGQVIVYAKQERTWELGTSLIRDAPTAIANKAPSAVHAIGFEPT